MNLFLFCREEQKSKKSKKSKKKSFVIWENLQRTNLLTVLSDLQIHNPCLGVLYPHNQSNSSVYVPNPGQVYRVPPPPPPPPQGNPLIDVLSLFSSAIAGSMMMERRFEQNTLALLCSNSFPIRASSIANRHAIQSD